MAVIQSNDQDFRTLLGSGDKIIVKFYADWCGSCKILAPKFSKMSEEDTFSDIQFVKINAEENPEIRKAVGVSNLPFFVTFSDKKVLKAGPFSKEDAIRELLTELNA